MSSRVKGKMGRRTRYLGRSTNATAAAWVVASPKDETGYLLLGKGDESKGLHLAAYDFKSGSLEKEISILATEESPCGLAAHPAGNALIYLLPNSCRLIEIDIAKQPTPISTEKGLQVFESYGAQKKITFSLDGSRVAAAGKDGRLRIFDWPGMNLLLEEHIKYVKDMSFSLDALFFALTTEDGSCRIWDLSTTAIATTLPRNKDEVYEFCRFSLDGERPFLFTVVNKEWNSSIGVFEIATWKKVGYKTFNMDDITALAISSDGKRLAIGSSKGDIGIVKISEMELHQKVPGAHVSAVTFLEFSSNSRGLLSLSNDSNIMVTTVNCLEWKDWQVYLLLFGLFILSALLCIIFYEYSDGFWNFPLGRDQPAKPSDQAVRGDP